MAVSVRMGFQFAFSIMPGTDLGQVFIISIFLSAALFL